MTDRLAEQQGDKLRRRMSLGFFARILAGIDAHLAHKAKVAKKFVKARRDRIELFYLPPYSPELNPDELAWAHVKGKVRQGTDQDP